MSYETLKQLARKYRTYHERPNGKGLRLEYGLMMLIASAQALSMKQTRMSVIEFGVYKGDGLGAICSFSDEIFQHTGLKFKVFGFDSAAGLPEVSDYRDHPEIWQTGDFIDVNYDEMKKGLPDFAQLVIGNFEETVPSFDVEAEFAGAPLGFVSVDCDLYKSARKALEIFLGRPELYLPSVLTYFDDIEDIITFNSFCGEELAIREFNASQSLRKIERKDWRLKGHYCCHILDHPVRTNRMPHGSFDIRIRAF